ncbi:MAG: BON domain-containing protein [Sulfuriferula multivorans]|uniref:BON domain-containing protein n=1 Tax=Sulfuriferula multivorans TaxID=1559896 RepID=A0A7C9NT20_9PROT|nr:BON domain-containing protein [Sulfuriferula multivorans]
MMHDGDASNTGINKRDRDDKTLTPMDQMNNPSDLKITQEIRQALMKDEFSMDAKNIKVITRNGAVTLRGPVTTTAELEKISARVKTMPGIKSIDNQLQVK